MNFYILLNTFNCFTDNRFYRICIIRIKISERFQEKMLSKETIRRKFAHLRGNPNLKGIKAVIRKDNLVFE